MNGSSFQKDLLQTRLGDAIARLFTVTLLAGFAGVGLWMALRRYPTGYAAIAQVSGVPVWLQLAVMGAVIALLFSQAAFAALGKWDRVNYLFGILAFALVASVLRIDGPDDAQLHRVIVVFAVGLILLQTLQMVFPRILSRFQIGPPGDESPKE